MSDSDIAYWGLIISCIVGVFGVLSAVYAARAVHLAKLQLELQQRTALVQNALSRPEIACGLISEKCPERIMLALPLKKERVAEVHFPLFVLNRGEKVAENISIYLRMPKTLSYNNFGELIIGHEIPLKKIESAFIAEENFSTIAFAIPRLTNFENLSLVLPFSIREDTQVRNVAHAWTKDRVQVAIEYEFTFEYIITIFAACDGAPPVSRTYTLQVLDTAERSFSEIINARNAAMVKQASGRKRLSAGEHFVKFIKYFWNAEYRINWLPKVWVYLPSQQTMIPDARLPIDRYDTKEASFAEGGYNIREHTYWIPALGTDVFGRAPAVVLPGNTDDKK
jgi:hypothetical protein